MSGTSEMHFLLLCFATSVAGTAPPSRVLTVEHLSVEHLEANQVETDGATLLAIDVALPRFSWRLRPVSSGVRDAVQVSYRIQLFAVTTETWKPLWDSGKVNSNNTFLVQYPATAPPLSSDTRF